MNFVIFTFETCMYNTVLCCCHFIMRPLLVIILTYMYLPTLKFDPSIGFCNDTKGICCESYVYQDGKCIECPAGTFDCNCTSKCLENYYGGLCSRKCDCSRYHDCSPSKGCIIDPYVLKAEYDSCGAGKEYSNRSERCCINQWKANRCIDCFEGYIGENCRQPCPHERFGHFCLGRCNCSVNEICDGRRGCLDKRKENSFITPLTPSLPRDLALDFAKYFLSSDTRGICCESYVYQDEKCIECPAGTFGYNCTLKCPENYYGRLCSRKCDCSRYHVCDPSKGCIDEPTALKDEYDSCVAGLEYSKRSGNCCVNQWKGKQCTDCWEGYFGENCQQRCPHERFGQFCLGRCSCTGNEICNKTLGCLASNIPRDSVNWKTSVGLVLGLLFVAFILAVIIRLKRQKRKFCNSNLTNVDISTTISEVPRVNVSEYPTMQRRPDTDVGIQSEAYSTFNDFKTCSEV